MAWHSRQQKQLVKGARLSAQIPITVMLLRIMTWRQIFTENWQLTGNTKWDDLAILAGWFKSGLNLKLTGILVGYYNGEADTGCSSAVAARLDKHNSRDLFELLQMLKRAGKITYTYNWLLNPERGWGGGALSKHRINTCKSICEQAVKKYGSRRNACLRLGINRTFLNLWLAY